MSLKIVQAGYALPTEFPVDPNAQFEPGNIGQLGVNGNNIVCGVSDGTAPIGIIDDIKTVAFTAQSIDEEVIAPAVGVESHGEIVSAMDVKQELRNPNVVKSSFVTNPVNVILIPRNGRCITMQYFTLYVSKI